MTDPIAQRLLDENRIDALIEYTKEMTKIKISADQAKISANEILKLNILANADPACRRDMLQALSTISSGNSKRVETMNTNALKNKASALANVYAVHSNVNPPPYSK